MDTFMQINPDWVQKATRHMKATDDKNADKMDCDDGSESSEEEDDGSESSEEEDNQKITRKTLAAAHGLANQAVQHSATRQFVVPSTTAPFTKAQLKAGALDMGIRKYNHTYVVIQYIYSSQYIF